MDINDNETPRFHRAKRQGTKLQFTDDNKRPPENHEMTKKIKTTPPKLQNEEKLNSNASSPNENTPTRYFLRSSSISGSNVTRIGSNTGRYSLGLLKSCRVTPFRTPQIISKIENLRFKNNELMKKTWKNEINDILRVYWKVCYLSSMTNFNYQHKNMRQSYESVLRTKVLGLNSLPNLDVKMFTSSCLTQDPSLQTALIIKMTITIQPEHDDEEEEIILPVYNAWLLLSNKIQTEDSDNMIWMPLMLYKGREAIHNVVSEWLQSSFGCYISPKMLMQSTMMWIASVWTRDDCNYAKHKSNRNTFVFTYGVKGLSDITEKLEMDIEINYSEMQKMNRIIGDKYEDISLPYMSEFHTTVQTFVSSITYIPSDMLRLHKIRTSCFHLDKSGIIKFLCPSKIPYLLNHLIELLQEALTGNKNVLS